MASFRFQKRRLQEPEEKVSFMVETPLEGQRTFDNYGRAKAYFKDQVEAKIFKMILIDKKC